MVPETENKPIDKTRRGLLGRAFSAFSRSFRGTKKAQLAVDVTSTGAPGDKKEPLLAPLKRQSSGHGLYSRYGLLGLHRHGADSFGFDGFLQEVGKFNPVYVEPFFQILMRRAAMPRIALIILSSALNERQYVVEGATPEIEKFHQQWIDRVMPQILKRAANAIWYGWQPYVIDWGVDEAGKLLPSKFNDVDPFTTQALEHEDTKAFAGLAAEGHRFGVERSFKLTWEGNYNNHYGEGQALTCYPYWWAHSVMLVWCLRYYERSVDPVRIAFAKNVSVPTGQIDGNGEPVHVDLTELVAEALDLASGGDSAAVPVGEEGEELVKLETLEMPDRSDTFLKMLAYLEQKQLTATLGMPGLGIATPVGDIGSQDSRVAEKVQLRILEHASNMPIEAINEHLLPLVHKANGLKGPVPVLRGKAFKREQQEVLLDLFKAGMEQPRPQIGEDGKPTGLSFRPGDLMRFDKVAKALDLPIHDIVEVARKIHEMEPQGPGKGGRPQEPLNPVDTDSGDVTRAEARASGRER